LIVVLAVLLDHLGVFGYHGDDQSHFNGRSLRVTAVTDRGTIIVGGAEVRLLGVDVPGADSANRYWAEEAKTYLTERLVGKTAILRLGTLDTRDAAKRLLAYVYLNDTDCFNVDIVRDGNAYADRRQADPMRSVIDAAENDARKRARGLWKEMKFWQMPKWRQDWLKHRPATEPSEEEAS
jgi:micrococcal nuclease